MPSYGRCLQYRTICSNVERLGRSGPFKNAPGFPGQFQVTRHRRYSGCGHQPLPPGMLPPLVGPLARSALSYMRWPLEANCACSHWLPLVVVSPVFSTFSCAEGAPHEVWEMGCFCPFFKLHKGPSRRPIRLTILLRGSVACRPANRVCGFIARMSNMPSFCSDHH